MKHVLAVDDSIVDSLLIYRILVKLGFIVTTCNTVLDAINSMGVRKVDVLVVDLAMPEIGGFELISYIREHDKKLPIVVISAFADEWNKQKAFQLGTSYYIEKPYTPDNIKRVFSQWL